MSENLSDFQRKRLENIKRNNDLLKNLNLKQLPTVEAVSSSGPVKKINKPKISSKPKKTSVKTATEVLPRRRNTRSSSKIKIPDSFRGLDEANIEQILMDPSSRDQTDELLKKEMEELKEEIEKKKNYRISGDIKLGDLIGADRLVHTDLTKLSAGDFFKKREIKRDINEESNGIVKYEDSEIKGNDDTLFDSLELYPYFPPNEIKIVNSRITSLFFHPLVDGPKLIVGGDKEGMLGFWNVKESPQSEFEGEIPDISNFGLFKSNVGNIGVIPGKATELFVSSYDGSFRIMDLNGLNCQEAFYMNPDLSGYNGISDVKFINSNEIYFTTLSGEFFKHDLRMKFDETGHNIPMRLSDKKIGSMDVDPTNCNTIATGSLDRSLRIWDVRKPIKSEDIDDLSTANVIKQYDSRLSISAVSYSPDDHSLVCNGYDNTIRLFDSAELNSSSVEMNPIKTITHNCKTGKWTSILKAKFKHDRNVFSIANMSRAIDIYNSNGIQLAHFETATVPAVTAWHPTKDWIVGGNASGKVFLFTDIYKN
ncbi:hypothetical protein QEN19_003105 [Hanseniaspora menglaensis]